MSFELWLQSFGETERAGIATAAVRSLFPIVERESEPALWRVRYDDVSYCEIHVTTLQLNSGALISMSVWRPCGDTRLWEALIAVLRMGSVFLFWPGSPPVVADESVASRVPKEVIASIGAPKLAKSADDLLRLLRET